MKKSNNSYGLLMNDGEIISVDNINPNKCGCERDRYNIRDMRKGAEILFDSNYKNDNAAEVARILNVRDKKGKFNPTPINDVRNMKACLPELRNEVIEMAIKNRTITRLRYDYKLGRRVVGIVVTLKDLNRTFIIK